ncbi:SDR family NAD(P)-dependent oxidoreductase [Streptomyces hokutonensis]|uniref:SDR family NAD(P)-dependent oxidoreductase n=1 Tax=Streptomyces hokutonensis TaxID=1306990 RepID=A0ABW6LWX3_9ACTN
MHPNTGIASASPRTAVVTGAEATAYVSDRGAVAAAVQAVREAYGPITIVVTSAGVETFASVTDITPDAWDRVMAVNLTGTFI